MTSEGNNNSNKYNGNNNSNNNNNSDNEKKQPAISTKIIQHDRDKFDQFFDMDRNIHDEFKWR